MEYAYIDKLKFSLNIQPQSIRFSVWLQWEALS